MAVNKGVSAPLQNMTAERLVIGAVLRSPHDYFRVNDILRAEMFTTPQHQAIFGAIAAISEEGGRLSFSLIVSRIGEEINGDDTESRISVLFKDAEGESALDYAGDIAECFARRRTIEICDRASAAAKRGELPALDVAMSVETSMQDIQRISTVRRPERIGDIVKRVATVSAASRGDESGLALPGFYPGIPEIDEIMGLIMPADLGFILASQGDGKTAVLGQILTHAANQKPALMFQFEMQRDDVGTRVLAGQSGVTAGVIAEGFYDFDQADSIALGVAALQASELYVHDEPEMTIAQMRAVALSMKRTKGLGVVGIDQLDKIKMPGRWNNKFERLEATTSALKVLAKEVGVAFIVLAQRTRMSQRRDDPMPTIGDADTTGLERDGDWVLAVWRRATWLMANKPADKLGPEKLDAWVTDLRNCENRAEAMMLKHRRRKPFKRVEMRWNGDLTRFESF